MDFVIAKILNFFSNDYRIAILPPKTQSIDKSQKLTISYCISFVNNYKNIFFMILEL